MAVFRVERNTGYTVMSNHHLQEINLRRGRTILMVTHDPNAASFCSRILFIQDGVIFHELRRKIPNETQEDFYARILQVMAQMGGGSANVL